MERGFLQVEREAMEEEGSPSRCGSGCQSGWTLYLDHSEAQRCCIPWMLPRVEPVDDDDGEHDSDDSMVSDASSGPSPRLFNEDALRRDGEPRCYSGSRGVHGSASASERSYGSSWSRIFQDQASWAVAVRDSDEPTRGQYNNDDDDDLDDTASSSAAFTSPLAAVVYIAPAESMSSTSYTTL